MENKQQVPAFRLLGITLDGIKNVEHGSLDFKQSERYSSGKADALPVGEVLGLYGANGTGKTAVVQSLFLLKILVSEAKSIDSDGFQNVPCEWSDSSSIRYSFFLQNKKGDKTTCHYTIELKKAPSDQSRAFDLVRERLEWETIPAENDAQPTPKLTNLFLDYTDIEGSVISSNLPLKGTALFGKSATSKLTRLANLISIKRTGIESGRFMLFTDEFLAFLDGLDAQAPRLVSSLIKELRWNLRIKLFVYTTQNDALSNLGAGALLGSVHDPEHARVVAGTFPLQIDGPFDIPAENRAVYDGLLTQVNVLVGSLVPGFEAKIVSLGFKARPSEENENDLQPKRDETIELVRLLPNGKTIPLSCESAGIRKFVSLASALAHVYSDPSTILVVDEMDSGVYEYLLGQILQAIKEGAKGQLLYTCHNLRPMEILHGDGVFFTTTNSKERFIQMAGLKTNNNARNCYFRAIQLGGQKEELYRETHASEIERALRRGGRHDEHAPN